MRINTCLLHSQLYIKKTKQIASPKNLCKAEEQVAMYQSFSLIFIYFLLHYYFFQKTINLLSVESMDNFVCIVKVHITLH